MKKRLKIVFALCTIGMLASCSSSDDNSNTSTVSPSSATLVFPDDNLECTEGTVVSDLESTITFQWQASANTNSYKVNLRNLNTNASGSVSSNTNQINITLDRGVPYEWFVSSVNGNQTAKSDTWRFYNQGPGVQNYAPFPASAVNPTQGQTVNAATSIALEWQGSDVDNDISEFEVFFGTNADPTTSIGVTNQATMNAAISSGQTYYWRVITKDATGNTSQSVVFDFKVL